MPRFGDPVDPKRATKGAPPIILQIQPTSYITVEQPEDLKQWEEDVRKLYGISLDAPSNRMIHYCYTCSGGCLDDCGWNY